MRFVLRTAATLALAVCAGAAHAGDPPPPPTIAGADVKSRIAAAQEMEKKDVLGLAKALDALGTSKNKDADRDFLLAYALQERARLLRMTALSALSHLDRKASAEWFKTHADGKDLVGTVVCLEALGYLGTKDDAAAGIEMIKNSDELLAVAGCDLAARLGTSGDTDAIAENGIAHASDHVSNHAAWAVQDIVKKPKLAVAVFERVAPKKSDPRAVRVAATIATLQDKQAEAHVWSDSLAPVHDLVLKAPEKIEIKTTAEDYRTNITAALDWLKTNMPAAELLVRAAAKRIDAPGVKHPDDWVDPDGDAILVPADRAVWQPKQLALHLFWMGTVLWEKRTGMPFKAHRGWEPALFEVYDLCVIARLYDAGPGGLSRANFMKDQIAKHPWGSQ